MTENQKTIDERIGENLEIKGNNSVSNSAVDEFAKNKLAANIQLDLQKSRNTQEWFVIYVILIVCSALIYLFFELVFLLESFFKHAAEKANNGVFQIQVDWHFLVFCTSILIAPIFLLSKLASKIFHRQDSKKEDEEKDSDHMPLVKPILEIASSLTKIVSKSSDSIKK